MSRRGADGRNGFSLDGWVERDGHRLSEDEVRAAVGADPFAPTCFGGEFFLRYGEWAARDHFGIRDGPAPAGTLTCGGEVVGTVDQVHPPGNLEAAILTAVELRATDRTAVALSGGVDSALVAALAERPAVVVGLEDSHDHRLALELASACGIECEAVTVTMPEVEEALREAVGLLGAPNPVDASIAATEVFVARWARDQGYPRVLTGQGADELFGGYARYLESPDLAAALEHDRLDLPRQVARDRAVASSYGTAFSPPYLDLRVVAAARALPVSSLIKGEVRKLPLRTIAAEHIPREFAMAEKKAMQYGSGIWKTIQKLARRNGHRRVGDYLKMLGGEER
ncbi:asparagine synthase (glutamine-hydrolyzing) [Methanofollis sp. W23]|uniref:asparagine synthase C-terminal domain-containing protein n=1 Tax=Methanofollis sp. W23 TaxID=2817849 RepID=UPI001AE6886D|nr:asparagine synthase-related protein [Methanofollis sp. W23]MBP2144793.1 asparagine synthase (glutamine-hydrolyzing) [Methanofollis sp. W23]